MKKFVQEVCERWGADVSHQDAVLQISVPPVEDGAPDELAARLGARDWSCVFELEALTSDRELVAPGSHILRSLSDLLGAQARRGYLIQPGRLQLSKKRLKGEVDPGRGMDLTLSEKTLAQGLDVYVDYRLLQRSRRRVDSIVTIKVELRPYADPVVTFDVPPDEAGEWESRPRKLPADHVIGPALELADDAAAQHAWVEGAALAEEVRIELGPDVVRLQAFYSGQMAEQRRNRRSDRTLERLLEMEEELELRLRELVNASKVHVDVDPLQLLVVEVPLQRAKCTFHSAGVKLDKAGSVIEAGTVWLNRASGAVTLIEGADESTPLATTETAASEPDEETAAAAEPTSAAAGEASVDPTETPPEPDAPT